MILKVIHQVVQVFTIQPAQFIHGSHSTEVGFRRFLEDKYAGDYKDGKYHGQGKMTYSDGSKHEGKYKNGKEQGQGTYTLY